jgi:hypothetical protein
MQKERCGSPAPGAVRRYRSTLVYMPRVLHVSIVALALVVATARGMAPRRSLTFFFVLPKATTVTVEIFSVDGRKVLTPITARHYEAGEHREDIDLTELAVGPYILRIETPERTEVQRFEVGKG